jgi:hypothetical protein
MKKALPIRMFASHPSFVGRLRPLILVLVLLACYAFTFPRWADWNQNSRLDQAMAIVDHGHLFIDEYVPNTGDYAAFEGHYYSDKAPLIAFLSTPVYAAIHALVSVDAVDRLDSNTSASASLGNTRERADSGPLESQKVYDFLALTVITFFVVAVPSAGLGLLLYTLAGWFGCTLKERVVVTTLYCLGTSAFPYSNALYSHQLTALLLFSAFSVLVWSGRRPIRPTCFLVVGLLLGCAVLSEYPAAVIGILLALLALWIARDRLRAFGYMIIGGLPPMIVLATFDWLTFRTLLPVAYQHSVLFPQQMQTGFFSLTAPHWDALWGISFSPYRGLFFLSPYLLFAVVGYIQLWRVRATPPEFWLLLLAPVAFILFNASSSLWDGGFAIGPRYILACLPFLALAAGIGVVRAWRNQALRPLVLVSIGWSLFAVWAETIAGQAFPDYSANPLFARSLPLLAAGDIARNLGMLFGLSGWASLLPLIVLILVSAILLIAPRPPRPTFLCSESAPLVAAARKWVVD